MTERTLLTFFLPKIHKKLFKIPGRPVVFNCDTPTGKLSKFLDHHLKTVMQSSWLKIKYSGDFPRKMKQIKKPSGKLYTCHCGCRRTVSYYPTSAWFEGIRRSPRKKDSKQICTSDLIKLILRFKVIISNSMEK